MKSRQRTEISTMLGVTNDLQSSKYLGLPSLVGRSKKKVFGFIKDKVWKKVQGWRAKSISQAGKTVLIKNGTQSIPSYCMSCFLIPKTLCQEIERILKKFWWSSNKRHNKGMSWLSWSELSVSKQRGGVGFRSLYGFDIALIGKQCWKLMQEPQSLVARMFKARYYPDSHFLQAKSQAGAGFIWSGMITAKEVLKKGCRWVIGDGKRINAVRDPWLRNKEGFCVDQSTDYGLSNIPVADLILQDARKWDEGKVSRLFSDEDARLILTSPIPLNPNEDRVVWHSTTNGQYSVKTGYHLWSDASLSRSNVIQGSGWSKLWNLDIPHKVKTFLWRFCRNTVPVRRRLSAKGVALPIICPMCGADVEHKLHLFFDCYFAKSCWQYVGLQLDMSLVEFAPEWLFQKLGSASQEELILIARVLWGIWFFRNKKVWDAKTVNNMVAMDWSAKFFADWKMARACSVETASGSRVSRPQYSHRWTPPASGVLKMNVDAAITAGADSFTIGIIVRDSEGRFVNGKVQSIRL